MYSGYKKQKKKYLEKDEFRKCEEEQDPDSYSVIKEPEYGCWETKTQTT